MYKYFLPYQERWLSDNSQIKIWEKSRQIGATYVQSYEDVRDCLSKTLSVWFSSADESAAKEYILYCQHWAKVFKSVSNIFEKDIIDEEKNIKTFVCEFKNGSRINAMSSNPKRFRSKRGKVILDEFAWHDNQKALFDAAFPATTWGFPLRILSTHNGKNSLFYHLIEDVKTGKRPNWSLHTTPIQLASQEGLVSKILNKKVILQKDIEEYLNNLHSACYDENTWLQEYCCIPVDESTAFLSYDMIRNCQDNTILPLNQTSGDLYVGVDIGRKKDLTVIIVCELLGKVLYLRQIIELSKTQFSEQKRVLFSVLSHPKIRRVCIDATGLGMQLAEEAQDKFGKFRVESITFTPNIKEDLAYKLYTKFEDRLIYIPDYDKLREDLHSVRKITTASGNIRFDVAKSETDSHADRFWALALSIHAADNKSNGPIRLYSGLKRYSIKLTNNY